MSISKDNTRMILTIPKELKAELERIAQEQNRSVNNLILTIIKNSISNTKDYPSRQPYPPPKASGDCGWLIFQISYRLRTNFSPLIRDNLVSAEKASVKFQR